MSESPFKIISEISEGKEISDIFLYNSFLTRRFFSYFVDTIYVASEMNSLNLSPEMEIDFYINSIKHKKRYTKWYKSEKKKNLDIIMEYYNYSYNKAIEIEKIINEEELEKIINYLKNEKGE